MPARKAETVAWASPGEARNPLAIAGRLGRYMSIATGPMAVSDPSRTTRPQGVRSTGEVADMPLLNGLTVPVFPVPAGADFLLTAPLRGSVHMSAMESQMPPVQKAAVNGIEIAYYEVGRGNGVPVIFCHGFPELAFSWRHQLKGFEAAGRWAIAADGRGYGLTSCPSEVTDY